MNGFLTDLGSTLKLEHYYHPSVMNYTHTHPQYELYFCPRKIGQTSVVNGVKYEYTYPCAILSAPFTVHSMSCDDAAATQYERYVFYFTEKALSDFGGRLLPDCLFGRNTGLLFALTEGQGAHLKRILDFCDGKSTAVQRELTFVLFLNQLLSFCPEENAVQVGTESFYLRDALEYIAKHFREKPDADAVARHCAVSRSKLDRDFKRFTGVTVHAYAEICMLNQAKYLLQHASELSVAEVASRCGFDSETYFFPFFKKHTGQTPSEFRHQGDVKNRLAIHEPSRGCGE